MTATFYVGDALKVLATLPENSVDLVLTSPPFLALRSYLPVDHPDKALEGGSQSTPGAYIDWLLDVMEACDRVLAPHGSICVELGDTYSGSGGSGGDYAENGLRQDQPRFQGSAERNKPGFGAWAGANRDGGPSGRGWPLPKSLSLIPESFRFAMVYGFNPFTGRQTERWRLRNVIRWVRPNPPVGALGDKFRPATSELMVFCKSAKRYFDLDAVREPPTAKPQRFLSQSDVRSVAGPKDKRGRGELSSFVSDEVTSRANPAGAPPLDWWNIPLLEGEEPTKYGPGEKERAKAEAELNRPRIGDRNEVRNAVGLSSLSPGGVSNPLGSPPLDWWNIPPGGYEGAHYAVMPKELCVKPIKAMCPEQVCRTCGEARRRIVDSKRIAPANDSTRLKAVAASNPRSGFTADAPEIGWEYERTTLGFTDCGHNDYRPGLVLDPFVGSGTTLSVATGHGRDAIGIDLDERNYGLALERVGPLVLQRGEVAA